MRGGAFRPPPWPVGQPDELLDYSVDASELLAEGDAFTSISLQIKPSGAGECEATDLGVEGGVITQTLSGGPPGREYLCRFGYQTLAGRKGEFFVRRPIDPLLARGRAKGWPPSTSFGEPVTWSYVGSFDLSNPMNSGYIALLAGF